MILVDSDSLLYRAGFVANEAGQEALAKWQLDKIIEGLYGKFPGNDFKFYISGSGNFRYSIYPHYKGNRTDIKRPVHLPALREHIVTAYGANVSDGIEADDQVSIDAYGQDVVVAHLDKDLDLIPGSHYNYGKDIMYDVSDRLAWKNFCMQLVQGDKADNIPGFDGKMRVKLPKFLEHIPHDLDALDDEESMLNYVASMYPSYTKFKLSADCLWLLRKEGDRWENWISPECENNLMAVLGHEDDGTALSPPSSDQVPDAGLQNSLV